MEWLDRSRASPSEAEYASYLTVAIVIYVGAALRPRYLLLAVGALAVLVPALVLESSRGAVLLVVVALGAMLGAWRQLPLVLAAGLGALLIVALGFGLRSYGTDLVLNEHVWRVDLARRCGSGRSTQPPEVNCRWSPIAHRERSEICIHEPASGKGSAR